mgnify:CR=1 FL=1
MSYRSSPDGVGPQSELAVLPRPPNVLDAPRRARVSSERADRPAPRPSLTPNGILPRRHHSPSLGRPPEFSTARVACLLVRGRRAVPPAAAKGVRPRRRAAIGCAATISRRRASLVSPQARGAQGCSSASQEWCAQLSAMRQRRVLDSVRIDAHRPACVGRVLA